MEFKSLKNIESSFRQIRLFSLVFLAACTLLTGFSVWKSYRFAEAQREKVYVLDEGKSLIMALSQDAARNRPVEAREHALPPAEHGPLGQQPARVPCGAF